MKRTLTLIVLACVSVTMMVSLTLLSGTASGLGILDFTPTVFVHLPLIAKQPTPTPTPPPQCKLYVKNSTGGRLCYQVKNSGIGEKCYSSSGTHYYGAFPPGTYSWKATARCGSISDSRYYSSGSWTHEFQCVGNTSLESNPSLLQMRD